MVLKVPNERCCVSIRLSFFLQMQIEAKEAKEALDDVKARNNHIQELESSINQLHDIFTQLAKLVQEQGQLVDNIERNVISASEYCKKAATDVQVAKAYQMQARRKKVFLLIGLVVILVVAIVVLVAVLKANRAVAP